MLGSKASVVGRCVKAFDTALADVGLPKETKVAVALAGGADSAALLWLAKRTFKDVMAITVYHNDCPRTCKVAEAAGKVTAQLKVEHHTILKASPSRIAIHDQLLQKCEDLGVKVLLTGHNDSEQINRLFQGFLGSFNFLERQAKLPPSGYHHGNLTVKLVRPLLSCTQQDLRDLCQVNELMSDLEGSEHSYVHGLLQKDAELSGAVHELQDDVDRCRQDLKIKVAGLAREYQLKSFGCVALDAAFLSHPWSVVWRAVLLFHVLITHGYKTLSYKSMLQLRKRLSPPYQSYTLGKLQLTVPEGKDFSLIASPGGAYKMDLKTQRIQLKEPFLWDGRWEITLSPLDGPKIEAQPAKRLDAAVDRQYFVRSFCQNKDFKLVRRGVRVIRSTKLPHKAVSRLLPVIMDDREEVVAIPHFLYLDRSFGIHATVKLKSLSMAKVLDTDRYV